MKDRAKITICEVHYESASYNVNQLFRAKFNANRSAYGLIETDKYRIFYVSTSFAFYIQSTHSHFTQSYC